MLKNKSKKVSYESIRKNKKLAEYGGAKMPGEYDEEEEDNDDDTEPEDEDTNDL